MTQQTAPTFAERAKKTADVLAGGHWTRLKYHDSEGEYCVVGAYCHVVHGEADHYEWEGHGDFHDYRENLLDDAKLADWEFLTALADFIIEQRPPVPTESRYYSEVLSYQEQSDSQSPYDVIFAWNDFVATGEQDVIAMLTAFAAAQEASHRTTKGSA